MDEVVPKKSMGQYWLNDQTSLLAICETAEIKPGDNVLEIGPGQGSLTEVLLKLGANVTAVELDDQLAAGLRQKFARLPFTLNMLSIMDFDFSSMPKDYKIVANIPYYLTAHLLRLLCETPHKPTRVSLLVQKEVAQRVVAAPGGMSVLSVSVQLYYRASVGQLVPAKAFNPQPKVDSQILIMTKLPQPIFGDVDYKAMFRLIKAGFANRRKTLLNSLSAGLHLSKDEIAAVMKRANIPLSLRAQELSLDDWHQLCSVYSRTYNLPARQVDV